MKFHALFKHSVWIFILFNILAFSTLFMPAVSIDKYVEYEFSSEYYNESYQSHTLPIATRIKPTTIIETLFTKPSELNKIKAEYKAYENELNVKLENNEITVAQYHELLSTHPATNEYKFLSINLGADKELSRLEGKTFLYAIIVLVFYVVCFISIVTNFLNLRLKKKLLSIINLFCGWIMAILLLIFNCYSFGLMLPFEKQITGFSGHIIEHTTICFSPKFIPIFLMFAFVAYGIFSIYANKYEDNSKIQDKEIPQALRAALSDNNKNKYRKINSKKSKYKHGSKKKRRR